MLFDATRIELHCRPFVGIISSSKISTTCPWWKHFLIKIQDSTSWNTNKLRHRSFHEIAATKLWEISRKTYVVELPFIKTTLQRLFSKWSQGKRCSKRTLCITASLKFCIPEIQEKTKTSSKKNIFWERSEIARKLQWKRSFTELHWIYFIKLARLVYRTNTLLKNTSYISWGVFKNIGKFSILSNLIFSIYHS